MIAEILKTRTERRAAGQLVATLVFGVPGMAFDPIPAQDMGLNGQIQPLPEIDIFDRFFLRRLPAALFPVMNPQGNALANVLAVGADNHLAGAFQCFQGDNGRHKLHAVVGGKAVTGAENLLMLLITQNRPIAARTGIAEARTISEYFYLLLHIW